MNNYLPTLTKDQRFKENWFFIINFIAKGSKSFGS